MSDAGGDPDRVAFACQEALGVLSSLAKFSREGVDWAILAWLEDNPGAGVPGVPLIEASAREDARFWVECASPAELQAYAVAAIDRLPDGMFTSRQIKRLVAALWLRMSPAEQEAFKKWIENDKR